MVTDARTLLSADLLPFAARVEEEIRRRYSAPGTTLDAISGYAMLPPGKLFRPILLLHSALAVGGDVESILPAAVGTECGHVASLIHDDIIDQDDLRRGRASVPARYGIPDAIVAGDMLIFQLFASLAECRYNGVPDSYVVSALEAVARAGRDMCLGQSMEAEIGERLDLERESYITMIRLKTAAFFRGACESGALLAGGNPALVAALGDYADNLGLAFQICDDLLPYVSTTERTGKAATSDIVNGRLTLPVILAYQRAEDKRSTIRSLLGGPADAAHNLELLDEILETTGAISSAVDIAYGYVAQAKAALCRLPHTSSRAQLASFADLAVDRYL